jgi:hypothetical protein
MAEALDDVRHLLAIGPLLKISIITFRHVAFRIRFFDPLNERHVWFRELRHMKRKSLPGGYLVFGVVLSF